MIEQIMNDLPTTNGRDNDSSSGCRTTGGGAVVSRAQLESYVLGSVPTQLHQCFCLSSVGEVIQKTCLER